MININDVDELINQIKEQNTKFIVVTGGVCSSIGKGVLASSLGVLLKNTGAKVSVIKMDPYLNVDPGTMSPLVHGEVFVTDDGAETDLDLGHYERTLETHLTKESSVSSGQIFQEILDGERAGDFLGKCIQLVPHVVDAIKRRALKFALKTKVDYLIIEIGGTVGDMEGEVFLEAARQLKVSLGDKRFLHCHLSYVPFLEWSNEIKTKPTQHSVMLLKKAGISLDCLFLRSDKNVPERAVKKVSVMCGVDEKLIFQVPTLSPTYKLFLELKNQKVGKNIQNKFGMESVKDTDISAWEKLITLIEKDKPKAKVGLVVKYVGTSEPYISVIKAIESAAWANEKDPEIVIISAEKLESGDVETLKLLKSVSGIIVPGGFDSRGIEGKIVAAKYARENKIPYLGLCLGLHVMLIEAARFLLKLSDATSMEFDSDASNAIITLLEEQKDVTQVGASMRLGKFPCKLIPGTLAHKAYGEDEISERHRHRYEVNNKYRDQFEKAGVIFSGLYEEKKLVEIAELKDHPFMIGVQFHPEFLSRPLEAHPLFKAFIKSFEHA
ncbi:CTP synthase [Candidatus Babeliales bacterium]|nr:CTP synthase [Candidatus Babeliales bacterium]